MRFLFLVFACANLFCTGLSYGQFNFVLNPSFELSDTCPYQGNTPSFFTNWDTLKAGGGGGPDTYSNCNSGIILSTPNQYESYQVPRSGGNYVNFGFFYRQLPPNINDTNYTQREYIQTRLKQKLTVGKSYCIKYYVSLWANCRYAIDELGAYLDDGAIHANYYKPAYINPQVKSPNGVFYTDTVNWLPVYGNFVADGTEEYLTIGNFKSEIATDFIIWNNATATTVRIIASYYIDDVSVIESDLSAYAGYDTTLLQGDSTFIGRTPEIGLECIWNANGVQLQTEDAGFWASPDSTTTYIVKQDLCDNIKYDTVVVTVIPNALKENLMQNVFELYPNPNNGEFSIKTNGNELLQLTICNILGEIIYTTQSTSNIIEIDLSKESKGIYFITVRGKESVQSKKVVIE